MTVHAGDSPERFVAARPGRPGHRAVVERVGHYEAARRVKDGATIAISLTVSPIRDASGGIVGASSIARIIAESDRRRAQDRAASQRARRLIEASLDALVTI